MGNTSRSLAAIFIALGLTACSSAESSSRETGTAAESSVASAGQSGICGLFTAGEIERAVGAKMRSLGVGAAGTGCSWEGANDEDISVGIQVIPDTNFWETPHGARGYEELQNIARSAYVVPQFGGWQAGALTDTKVAVATMEGGSSTRESTIELLKNLLKRI